MKKLLEKVSKQTLFFKFDLKMKLTTLFLLVALFNVQAKSYSQKAKISLDMDNVSITDVINEIESKSEFRFIYKIREVDTQRKVSVHVTKEHIEKILRILFSDAKIEYKVLDRQIILRRLIPPNNLLNKANQKNDTSNKQQLKVGGVVKDENEIPIAGVNVIIKGTFNGTSTDFDGNYQLNVQDENSVLVFSYVGYLTQEITVEKQKTIDVVLIQNSESLQEVVVQAYRTTTNQKNSAAISKISAEAVENKPNTSLVNTLQARVPGLVIGSGSGQPGANSSVNIRGIGSLNGETEPLFVIDGTPVDGDDFRGINPNDIANVSVLKDAAATATYGNRGAHGVVIITTKTGSYKSKLEISYSQSYGRTYQQDNTFDLMNSRDLLNLQKELGVGRGGSLTDAEINVLANQNNTDWTDFIFQKGISQNHQIGLSYGSENLSTYTSFSYTDQEGIVRETGLERYTLRSNIRGKSNKFKYGLNSTIGYSNSKITTNLGSGFVFFNPIVGALWGQPFLNPYRLDGTVNDDSFDRFQPLWASPYIILNNFRYNPNTVKQIKSVISANASYEIVDGLSINGQIGIDYQQEEELRVIHPESTNRLFFPRNGENQGRQIERYRRDFALNINGSIKYVKTFGQHTIDASIFAEKYKLYRKSFGLIQLGLDSKTFSPGDGDSFIDGGTEENGEFIYIPRVESDLNEGGLFSYFTIVDYDYNNKFGFTGTLRRDASFRFASTNRWGTFYSLAGRWNLDQEDFIENISFINNLKLRASYGEIGSERISGGDFFNAASASRTIYRSDTGYNNTTGYFVDGLGFEDLIWETTTQTNIGLDYGLFDNRVRGTVDFYNKKAVDLFSPRLISAINGQYNVVANGGSVQNRGVELSIQYDVISNEDLKVNIFGNVSYNKNELLDLPAGDEDNERTINAVGHAIGSYYLVPYLGVNPANGNALYRTKEGGVTEVFNTEDRVISGSPFPTYQGGFGTSIDYKGFFLESNFSFIADVKRFNQQQAFFSTNPRESINFNVSSSYNRAWTPENPITDQEGLFSNQADTSSDKFLHDASYLRLRYLSVGYNFSEAILSHLPIKSCRVYVQGENLLTWTKWQGLDVEANVGRNFDFSDYPNPRIFTAGIDVKF
ncbi:SusC/RagA family TonB-linked outer membrane protein [Flavivirga abyssicola]|uniref:SusC/RagA family TonB-linked outer membrane protein n=1 Tax=Flavivirga abyssicola TaxID=3063533 RepID=UPI0026DF4362|nr:SusC/RagA family TonB-linked outer membrane protein [Flavivirga sp. MEBiC07777]WVK15263.1 SusC/RagA family TonB-linked outer membrane protein [Flavivirga sp. MEBiC07777]